jgi:hypothetical protein
VGKFHHDTGVGAKDPAPKEGLHGGCNGLKGHRAFLLDPDPAAIGKGKTYLPFRKQKQAEITPTPTPSPLKLNLVSWNPKAD